MDIKSSTKMLVMLFGVLLINCCFLSLASTSESTAELTSTTDPQTSSETFNVNTLTSTTDPQIFGETSTVPTVCSGDTFRSSLCADRLNEEPNYCDDPVWYRVCCAFCDELAGATAVISGITTADDGSTTTPALDSTAMITVEIMTEDDGTTAALEFESTATTGESTAELASTTDPQTSSETSNVNTLTSTTDPKTSSETSNVNTLTSTTDLQTSSETSNVYTLTSTTDPQTSSETPNVNTLTSTTDPQTSSETSTVLIICNGDTFPRIACVSRLNDEPNFCDDPAWYGVCCAYCNELAGATVITSAITAANSEPTTAIEYESTAVIASGITTANDGATTSTKFDAEALDISFGIQTHPNIIILTVMIAMPQILS